MLGVPTLYIDYEMGAEVVAERFVKMGIDNDTMRGPLWYEFGPKMKPLNTEQGGLELLQMCNDHEPTPNSSAEFIVIDSIARSIEGSENDSQVFLELERHTIDPLRTYGKTILLVDHLSDKGNVDSARSGRGSTRKLDFVDVQWKMTAAGSEVNGRQPFRLKNTKDRLGRHNERSFDYYRTQAPLRYQIDTLTLSDLSESERQVLDILTLEGRSKLSEPLVQEIMETHTGTGVRRNTALRGMRAYKQGLGTLSQQ